MKAFILSLLLLSGLNSFSQTTKNHIDFQKFLPISETVHASRKAAYTDTSLAPEQRALDLIRRMTFKEKCTFSGGWSGFFINGIPRLGIRPVYMADASQGLRFVKKIMQGKSTAYPGMLSLASTWNENLAKKCAESISKECRAYGVDLLLGPGVNMQRVSSGGRNYEYMGEDPYLTSVMATEYVKGMQENGIISVMKHFICNDQEFVRHIASSNVSERALREIYLPVWEKAIKEGGLAGIMSGNNLTNGVPMCMNNELIDNILRKEYDFKGIAMTDWKNSSLFLNRQSSILPSGMNLMMPDNKALMKYINEQIEVSPERKDEIEALLEYMIYPTLYTLFKFGIYDRPFSNEDYMSCFDSHKKVAKEIAEEAIILLKNKGILPIPSNKKILMINHGEIYTGSGSGAVPGYDHVSYIDGLKGVFGDNVKQSPTLEESQLDTYDVVIYVINKIAGEGADTPYDFPEDQLSELRKVVKLHKHVLVLINASNTIPMDWLDDAKGVLWCGHLGQERGSALANIISGKVSPSGKLPFTIEKDYQDIPSPRFNFLGGKPYWNRMAEYINYWKGYQDDKCSAAIKDNVKPSVPVNVDYNEGIYMGYRWFDHKKLDVSFPFGFGLSYTKFEYSNLKVDKENGRYKVVFNVRNEGKMEAKEIVQLYISNLGKEMDYPVKELKAFKKISLKPAESKKVIFYIDNESLKSWNEKNHSWFVENGDYKLRIGSSSKDIRLTSTISRL